MLEWRRQAFIGLIVLILLTATTAACRGTEAIDQIASPAATAFETPPRTSTATPIPAPVVNTATPVVVINAVQPLDITPTPFYSGPLSPPCGLLLDPLPAQRITGPFALEITDAKRVDLQEQLPAAAWPALKRLLDAPETVGLVAFQAGHEDEGIYLNSAVPMPLASVTKLIILAAYSEAVSSGELDPLEQITLAELDRYYLPNFDLGAHRRALAELGDLGRIHSTDDDPSVSLDDVAWMMIRHSSNAASDYLHLRLGQSRIEETAIALGLNNPPDTHSAPCLFLGQFLMMGNHLRNPADDLPYLSRFSATDAAEAENYGQEISLLADAYINDQAFREAERAWRSGTRRPAIETQRFFTNSLATQGTAEAYASLMTTFAQNGLSNADSSFHARRILEWPNQFVANKEFFSNIGYKNGSLPGTLTTTYYAYRWNDAAPVIVVLFYRDLPQQTYRQWLNNLPHDELARWLLIDPTGIPTLSKYLDKRDAP